MFDSLKKRLKETIEKVSKGIKEGKKEKEEAPLEEISRDLTVSEEKEIKPAEEELEAIEYIEEISKQKEFKPPEKLEEEEKVVKEYIEKKEHEEKETKRPGLFSRLFEKTITEEDARTVLKELEIALLENDVALEVAERIGNEVKSAIVNKSVRRGKVADVIKAALRDAMLDVMKQQNIDIDRMIQAKDGVFTIIFLGFNGTGKTTSLAKFAKKFAKYKPIIAAADTFRAASIEQLEEHSKRLGFRVVKHQYGSDSAAVIFDAKKAAVAEGSKLVIADTAGRSHSNVNLMDELKKICRVNNPDLKILVLDSVTGNDIFEQSKLFNNAVGVDAIILTKADVYDKGGAALSAAHTIKKPILYLGIGQEYDDLKEFRPEEIVDNLLK